MQETDKKVYIVTSKDRDGQREVIADYEDLDRVAAVRFASTVEKKHMPEIWERINWDF